MIKILEEMSISLVVSQAKQRLMTPQTSQVVKQIICSCGILPRSTSSYSKHHLALTIRVQEMLSLSEVEEQKVQTHQH